MAIKCKRKKRKEPEIELYEFEIEDWMADCSFGVNQSFFQGDYNEHSTLIIVGNIISPKVQNTPKARIQLIEGPEFESHWEKNQPTSPQSIGSITLLKDISLLEIFCRVPPRYFKNILIFVSAGKIKFCSVYGTKIKWSRGLAYRIRFSTEKEEE
jgi:hypothetical protein